MTEEKMPQCPGCHIGCSLAKPGCGKGLGFVEMLARGEELPERRGPGGPGGRGPKPGPGGPGGPGGPKKGFAGPPNATPEMRMNHLIMCLTLIMPKILGGIEGLQKEDRVEVVSWTKRFEGKMSQTVMPERIRGINTDALPETLASLTADGYLAIEEINGLEYYAVTEAGEAFVANADAAREAAIKKALSELTEDEVLTMVQLCHKIMDANRPAGGPPRP